jgi:hypothetical protein
MIQVELNVNIRFNQTKYIEYGTKVECKNFNEKLINMLSKLDRVFKYVD